MFEKEVIFEGKHATYLNFLVDDAKVFTRNIDVYMNGALFGFLYGKKSDKDKTSTDKARINVGQLLTESLKINFIYRLIMLLDESGNSTNEEKINRAFRDDTIANNDEKLSKNFELFMDYARGGIEILHQKFTEGCTTEEDYINRIYDIVTEFKEENEGVQEDKIREMIADYT